MWQSTKADYLYQLGRYQHSHTQFVWQTLPDFFREFHQELEELHGADALLNLAGRLRRTGCGRKEAVD